MSANIVQLQIHLNSLHALLCISMVSNWREVNWILDSQKDDEEDEDENDEDYQPDIIRLSTRLSTRHQPDIIVVILTTI